MLIKYVFKINLNARLSSEESNTSWGSGEKGRREDEREKEKERKEEEEEEGRKEGGKGGGNSCSLKIDLAYV